MTVLKMRAVIIFAAGLGTRMQSSLPKVMHTMGGRSMVEHVLATAKTLEPDHIILVTSPLLNVYLETHKKKLDMDFSNVTLVEQKEALGTGHAMQVALPHVKDTIDDIILLYGDVPLVTKSALEPLLKTGSPCCFLGMHVNPPHAYGRMTVKEDALLTITEHKDATEEERQNNYVWSGVLRAKASFLKKYVSHIQKSPHTGEYYLVDIINLANKEQPNNVTHVESLDANLFEGVNDKADLANIEARFQQQKRQECLKSGVKLIAPETVFFSFDTHLHPDVVIHPYVTFGKGVRVATHATIHSFCHIEDSIIHANASIGPFAHLRGGNLIKEKASIGNFVEVKKTTLHARAKAKHLTYLGDADIGEGSNVGAGTITCNYDGIHKHKTFLGNNVFVGANTTLIAPITVKDGAMIAAGSVITQDIPEHTLAFGRARQINKQKPSSMK